MTMKNLIALITCLLALVSCNCRSSQSSYMATSDTIAVVDTIIPEVVHANVIDLGLSVLWADRNFNGEDSLDCGWYYTASEANALLVETWGEGWRVPTGKEMRELRLKCAWNHRTCVDKFRNHINGYIITGPSGKSIFLPSAGRLYFETIVEFGDGGHYITSSRNSDGDYIGYWWENDYRETDELKPVHTGSLRPVKDKSY